MAIRKEKLFALCCFFIIAVALVMPAYADIKSFKTDKTFYKKGDKIIFSGTVGDKDVGEFVTVVVDDPAGNFVTLGSGYVTVDKNFTVTIDTNAKKIKEKFISHGVYNATGFVENKTNSKWVTFDFSLDGSPVIHTTSQPAPTQQSTQPSSQQNPTPPPESQITSGDDTTQSSSSSSTTADTNEDKKTIQEKIKERIEAAKKLKEAQVNQQNQNMPIEAKINQTDSDESVTVTGDTTVKENKPVPTGVSIPIDLGANLLYIVIGLGGAGAVAGVVYGLKAKSKRKPDDKPVVKIRETHEKTPSPAEDDYALMILKNRLAKGEITIEEYNALKEALREP